MSRAGRSHPPARRAGPCLSVGDHPPRRLDAPRAGHAALGRNRACRTGRVVGDETRGHMAADRRSEVAQPFITGLATSWTRSGRSPPYARRSRRRIFGADSPSIPRQVALEGRCGRRVPDGMSASTSALTPAEWVLTSSHRSWSRCNDSLSPSGKAASRCELSCTSGSSRTASTRLARLPGGMCPDSARKEARTVRSGPDEMVTSAAATVCSPSLISTCRCPL